MVYPVRNNGPLLYNSAIAGLGIMEILPAVDPLLEFLTEFTVVALENSLDLLFKSL